MFISKESFFALLEQDASIMMQLQKQVEAPNFEENFSSSDKEIIIKKLNNPAYSLSVIYSYLRDKKYIIYMHKDLLKE
jgi:hypothetical protein